MNKHITDSRPKQRNIATIPAVRSILLEAAQIRSTRRATTADYLRLRRRLGRRVGWAAADPDLRDGDLYDAAVAMLVEALGV